MAAGRKQIERGRDGNRNQLLGTSQKAKVGRDPPHRAPENAHQVGRGPPIGAHMIDHKVGRGPPYLPLAIALQAGEELLQESLSRRSLRRGGTRWSGGKEISGSV